MQQLNILGNTKEEEAIKFICDHEPEEGWGIMKSGIFDKNGIEVREGDTLVFPYIDPKGQIHEDKPDFQANVEFKHGCFGYDTRTGFMPLIYWSKTEEGDYIPNHGIKSIILDEYPFWIKASGKEGDQ